ncbi:AAA+-type ATPase [Mycoblastus sanguinarius]|nr:AAA+-type ATPase [Mycoblastus sanguinarius]
MACSKSYSIRPTSNNTRPGSKHFFRVYVSAGNLMSLKLNAGDAIHLQNIDDGSVRPVIVWSASSMIQDSAVQIPASLQTLYGLKQGGKVVIIPEKLPIEIANVFTLREISPSQTGIILPDFDKIERSGWAWILTRILGKAEILSPGMVFDNIEANDQKRTFKITQINSSSQNALYRANAPFEVNFFNELPEAFGELNLYDKGFLKISNERLGGLDKQIDRLNEIFSEYSTTHAINNIKKCPYYRPRSWNLLLHGPKGTGKSAILDKICKAGWQRVFHIDESIVSTRSGESAAAISKIFSEALLHQPSVIIMDDLDFIAGKSQLQDSVQGINLSRTLCKGLDGLGETYTLAVGVTRKLADIDQSLRRIDRLDMEIEIPVPSSKSRAEILKVFIGIPKDQDHPQLDRIAKRLHAFVGEDIQKLLKLAADKAQHRIMHSRSNEEEVSIDEGESEEPAVPEESDIYDVLPEVRPTAMQEIFVETSNVTWKDIVGHQAAISEIEKAIIWPQKYPDSMKDLKPKKGIVLHGPPGCSKTMIAKAAANESGLNLISVRGPELLKMYVGESERAVREVFDKARAAKPCIIFFDEFESIGARRDGLTSGGHQMVSTLLTEMDGYITLHGVYVLAATNRLDMLDAALIRPGRFDKVIEIGLPTKEDRRSILRLEVNRMSRPIQLDIEQVANETEGKSGAELVEICRSLAYDSYDPAPFSGRPRSSTNQ